MSDFEDRLGRALREGAEDASGTVGLAEGARGRARRRRNRRMGIGAAAAAVVAIALPVAIVSSGSGTGGSGTDKPPVADTAGEGQQVTCSGGASWAVATMDGGLSGALDDGEVRAAFGDVLAEAPLDAPTAIREQGADQATYIVLAEDGDSYTLGIGSWGLEGPRGTAMVAGLDRQPDGGLRMTSWGDCSLESVVPPGRSLVEVTAPDGGVDPSTIEPGVVVSEAQCASGRDPAPYLGEPTIVENADQVLVTLTSEAVVGGADCQGNPFVHLTLSLEEPIGDRELLDSGTYPPTPIQIAPVAEGSDDEWQTVTYEGDPVNESGDNRALVDLPPGWELLDTSGCEPDLQFGRFGLPENDPCEGTSNVTIYGSGTGAFTSGPGLDDQATEGYAYAGGLVGYVDAPDHETARRILASLRGPGEAAPSAAWRTEDLGDGSVDLPDDDSVSIKVSSIDTERDIDIVDRSWARVRDGVWVADVVYGVGTSVRISAATQALADLVASTVRPAG